MEKFQLPPEYDTEQLQELVRIFPQFWRESYFDFDEFKAYISGIVPDDLQEKYSFTWHGKTESYRLLKKNSNGTLRPYKEDSVNWDTTQNLYIEGDNLEVLKLIKHTYAGEKGVKMIYIDPPYNTSEDFIYDDNFMDSLDKYLEYTNQKGIAMPEVSGRYHTRWLNMMHPRLWLANYLLRDDGVIFISIDDREVTNLRRMCDEIFGEENFVAQIANTNNPKGRSDDKFVATAHEYIVVYAKDINQVVWYGFEPTEEITKRYNKTDVDGRKYREIDLRKTGDSDLKEDRPNMFYYFYYNEITRDLFPSHEKFERDGYICIEPLRDDNRQGRWRWGIDTAKDKLDTLIPKFMPSRKIWGIMEKDFLEGRTLVKPTSSWTFKDVNSERGTEEFLNLEFERNIFKNPKPLGTIYRCLKLATAENDFVLDFFSGSGTTAQAVMKINADDGGNRRFISVQIPEDIDPVKYKIAYDFLNDIGRPTKISEIGKERIRRAGAEIAKTHLNVDTGFRVFKLDKSNFKIWDDTPVDPKNPSEVARLMGQLELHADSPFIDGRTHEDIVYEIMRMNNYPLTTTIIPIEINGKTVYGIGEDCDFIICIDATIDEAAAEELCSYRPGRILFTDNCFKNTETRVNVEHTIKNINEKIKLRVV